MTSESRFHKNSGDARAHASNRIPLMRKVEPALQSFVSQQCTSHSIVLKAAMQVVLASVTQFSLRRHFLANVSTSPTLVYTFPHLSKAGAHVWLDFAQPSQEIVVEQVKQVKLNTGWTTKKNDPDHFGNKRAPKISVTSLWNTQPLFPSSIRTHLLPFLKVPKNWTEPDTDWLNQFHVVGKARAYLRKDNSYKNWSKAMILTFLKRTSSLLW